MILGTLYARFFSRGVLGKLNDKILTWSLKARGYDNYRNATESGELFFIKQILAKENPKLCVDVGANIGKYTCDLIEHTSANVIAFEPLPPAFVQLKDEVSSNNDRVTLENVGVGNKTGELEIHYSPEILAHASFSEEVKKISYVTNEESTTVKITTLDEYCEANQVREIDLLKIDTEGYESEVLDGAQKCIREIRPKFVQVEFNLHQMYRHTSLFDFSERLPGYDVYQLLPNSWVKRDPNDPLTNFFKFSNFVFVRGE